MTNESGTNRVTRSVDPGGRRRATYDKLHAYEPGTRRLPCHQRTNGREALERVRDDMPDIILLRYHDAGYGRF